MAECLATETPMLLYRPQPGQEMGNAIFAEQMGAACIARDTAALERVLQHMANPEVLTNMKKACLRLAHVDAAAQVVDTCLAAISHCT